MYLPSSFALNNESLALELIRAHSFAVLVGLVDGVPEIAHGPVLVDEQGGELHLSAHVARANPLAAMARAGAELTIVFQGPHGYVSPRLYATAPQVPTWNYAVVHARGTMRALDAEATLAHLRSLSEVHERSSKVPWTVVEAEELIKQIQSGIVAFELRNITLQPKFKLSQNRAPEDRASVLAHYEQSSNHNERLMAKWMRALEPPTAS